MVLTTMTVVRQYKCEICLWQCWLNSKHRPLLVTVNFKTINNKTNTKIMFKKWKALLILKTYWDIVKQVYF